MVDFNNSDLECLVCFESKTIQDISFLPCIHFLCTHCYEKLTKNECPFCRNCIKEEIEEYYDERENEYNDVDFEMMVSETNVNERRKRKKRHKRILKFIKENQEMTIEINRNNVYRILNIE